MYAGNGAVRHRLRWIAAVVALSLADLVVACLLMHEGVRGAGHLSGAPARTLFAIGLEMGVVVTCLMFVVLQLAASVVRRFGPAGKVKNSLLCVAVGLLYVLAFGTAAYLIVLREIFAGGLAP